MFHGNFQPHRAIFFKRCMRAAIVLAAIGTLAGCGNLPSGQAQQDATSASYGASKLLVYAGDYRPSLSLLQQTTSPLSEDQFDQLKEQADGSQAATFLAPRPAGTDLVETDLLAAQSLLSSAASNPDLADQLKSVINAQQALVSMAQVDRIIYQMQSALDAARNQTVNLSVLSLQLANYRSQIAMLQQEQQAYAQANELDLADAQQKAVQAQQTVDDAAQKLDALKTQMTYNQQKAADYNSEGMILRNESQNITGQGSLDAFRQGGDEFNTAAAYSQKAQVLESQVDVASQELSVLNLNKQAADASVQAISNERAAAVQIARQDANQIAVLQTQARSLILGATESDALSGAQSIQ